MLLSLAAAYQAAPMYETETQPNNSLQTERRMKGMKTGAGAKPEPDSSGQVKSENVTPWVIGAVLPPGRSGPDHL